MKNLWEHKKEAYFPPSSRCWCKFVHHPSLPLHLSSCVTGLAMDSCLALLFFLGEDCSWRSQQGCFPYTDSSEFSHTKWVQAYVESLQSCANAPSLCCSGEQEPCSTPPGYSWTILHTQNSEKSWGKKKKVYAGALLYTLPCNALA